MKRFSMPKFAIPAHLPPALRKADPEHLDAIYRRGLPAIVPQLAQLEPALLALPFLAPPKTPDPVEPWCMTDLVPYGTSVVDLTHELELLRGNELTCDDAALAAAVRKLHWEELVVMPEWSMFTEELLANCARAACGAVFVGCGADDAGFFATRLLVGGNTRD